MVVGVRHAEIRPVFQKPELHVDHRKINMKKKKKKERWEDLAASRFSEV